MESKRMKMSSPEEVESDVETLFEVSSTSRNQPGNDVHDSTSETLSVGSDSSHQPEESDELDSDDSTSEESLDEMVPDNPSPEEDSDDSMFGDDIGGISYESAVKYKAECIEFIRKISADDMWKIRKELKKLKRDKNYFKFGKLTPLAAVLMYEVFCQSLK